MINGLVNHKKTVVGFGKDLNINGFILRIMQVDIVLQGR